MSTVDRKLRRRNRRMLTMLKRERGCVDCGAKRGRLEFDHRSGEVKLFNIAHGCDLAWFEIAAEVAKCDVRCSRCHRIRHLDLRRESGTAPWHYHVSGIAHPAAKLTPEKVREIRSLYDTGQSQRALAADFGVTKTAIANIVNRVTWIAA